MMSTEKSLKHLKSEDEFLVPNVSNYFEKHSGRDSSSYIQHTFQATGVRRRTIFRETGTLSSPQRSKQGQYKQTIQTCERPWLGCYQKQCAGVLHPPPSPC